MTSVGFRSLAERVDLCGGRVDNGALLDDVGSSIQERVKGHGVKDPVGNDDEISILDVFGDGRDELVVELREVAIDTSLEVSGMATDVVLTVEEFGEVEAEAFYGVAEVTACDGARPHDQSFAPYDEDQQILSCHVVGEQGFLVGERVANTRNVDTRQSEEGRELFVLLAKRLSKAGQFALATLDVLAKAVDVADVLAREVTTTAAILEPGQLFTKPIEAAVKLGCVAAVGGA